MLEKACNAKVEKGFAETTWLLKLQAAATPRGLVWPQYAIDSGLCLLRSAYCGVPTGQCLERLLGTY